MSINFEDETGQSWHCRIDWNAIRRSAAAGVDLSNAEQVLGEFYRGSHKLIDALEAVLRDQIAAVKIERDEFERRIVGEVMERATAALVAGLVDFFPPTRASLIEAADQEIRQELASLHARFVKPSTGSPEN